MFLPLLALTGLPSYGELTLDERQSSSTVTFNFDGSLKNSTKDSVASMATGKPTYVDGLEGRSLRFGPGSSTKHVSLAGKPLHLSNDEDFSVSFWVRTTVDSSKKMVLLSQKQVPDNSLASQKVQGWSFGAFNGTWAWNIGSGIRRLTYNRDNGEHMPINDGRWHQLAMSYDSDAGLVRLFFDGTNWVTYNVDDSSGFDFSTDHPIEIGWSGEEDRSGELLPLILQGRDNLQEILDAYNEFNTDNLQQDEFLKFIVDPTRFIDAKFAESGSKPTEAQIDEIEGMTNALMRNPFTVHQSEYYMLVAHLLKVYRIEGTKIRINQEKAASLSAGQKLSEPEFDIDNLSIYDRKLTPQEVLGDYESHFISAAPALDPNLKQITASAFNIHHGGIHETVEEDGWDSRLAIVDLIKREKIDLIMMQETYSHGDFIAAELGFYFATTVDWDNMNQGANISVISRYPIKDVTVPPNSAFMNVSALVSISETQDMYEMSNWYGMRNFQDVFDFHKERFADTDNIPVLFAGDFNAVPHTDGGSSLASETLIGAGFTDAYRSLYPDHVAYPGPTHRGGRRIDQIYYKGAGMKNTATEVFSTWPSIFPSDHYLIKSVFKLDYRTRRGN